MKKLYLLLLLFGNILFLGQVYAQEDTGQNKGDADLSKIIKSTKFTPGWGIGLKASTLGFGADIVKSFNSSFTLRLGASYYNHDFKISSFDDLGGSAFNYTTVGSVSLLFDWYFAKSVYLSAGLIYNMSVLEIESKANKSQYIGEIEITPETMGSINYTLKPNDICPYLGIGFGHTISRNKLIAFNFDLGALYQGSPKVTLDATGMVAPTANEEQRQLLQDNVKSYMFYPFLNFQLSFRLF
jgi:hypothetical protein